LATVKIVGGTYIIWIKTWCVTVWTLKWRIARVLGTNHCVVVSTTMRKARVCTTGTINIVIIFLGKFTIAATVAWYIAITVVIARTALCKDRKIFWKKKRNKEKNGNRKP